MVAASTDRRQSAPAKQRPEWSLERNLAMQTYAEQCSGGVGGGGTTSGGSGSIGNPKGAHMRTASNASLSGILASLTGRSRLGSGGGRGGGSTGDCEGGGGGPDSSAASNPSGSAGGAASAPGGDDGASSDSNRMVGGVDSDNNDPVSMLQSILRSHITDWKVTWKDAVPVLQLDDAWPYVTSRLTEKEAKKIFSNYIDYARSQGTAGRREAAVACLLELFRETVTVKMSFEQAVFMVRQHAKWSQQFVSGNLTCWGAVVRDVGKGG